MSSGEIVAPVSGTERLMTLAMFAIQIAISKTYGQFQPLRRRPRRFNS